MLSLDLFLFCLLYLYVYVVADIRFTLGERSFSHEIVRVGLRLESINIVSPLRVASLARIEVQRREGGHTLRELDAHSTLESTHS
jgi:hypothetical protein